MAVTLNGSHGGRRAGAGRPKGSLGRKKLVSQDIAIKILHSIDEKRAWTELLASMDQRIKLEALRYLCDRAYGKAVQAVDLQANVNSVFQIIVERVGA